MNRRKMDGAIIASMERVMIQADRDLLERARAAAHSRGVSFPAFVRAAIENELRGTAQPPLTCVGVVDMGGQARLREWRPDPWR
jgi:hypothetical protein